MLYFFIDRDMPLVAVRQVPASISDTVGGVGIGSGGSAFFFRIVSGSSADAAFQPPPRSMLYSPAEHAVLLSREADGGTYKLNAARPRLGATGATTLAEPPKISGVAAVFVGCNQFATLQQRKEIVVRDIRIQISERVPYSIPGADWLLSAGSRYVLARPDEQTVLMDL